MKPCGNGLFLFSASLCLSSSFSPLFSDYLAKVGIVVQTCSLLFVFFFFTYDYIWLQHNCWLVNLVMWMNALAWFVLSAGGDKEWMSGVHKLHNSHQTRKPGSSLSG